jgi:hypothetical protein
VKYHCNGAITEARDLQAAAEAFATLAALDQIGEDGIASARYMTKIGGTYRALIGRMDKGGRITGEFIDLVIMEVE